ncbi:HAD-IA family hydrolase [Candidatus Dojkabacteria bacterium]|nr:HAD-IA family hydrolase [Candidatus Dojkabacteria bacterium]
MKKFDAVIFDFNGVLWWDSQLQTQAWKKFSKELRGKEFTDQEIEEHVHGRNNRYTIEFLLGRKVKDEQELEELTQGKESTYRDLCLEQGSGFKLSPGAIELLDFLKENDVPRTIATASEISNLKFFFENLELDNWFELEKVVYDDGSRPGKPAPDNFLEAAKRLKHRPEDCIVIEDSSSGIVSAQNAGIGHIIGLGPKEKHEDLEAKGVNETIESFLEFDYGLL